jgi:hypothetical protein
MTRHKNPQDYKLILRDLKIKQAIDKYGEEKVRWAMNKWLKSEANRKRLLKRKSEVETELKEIDNALE